MREDYLNLHIAETAEIQLSKSGLNILDRNLLQYLLDIFIDLDANPDVKVIVITGSGKSFVAGADIKELQSLDSQELRHLVHLGHQLMNTIESLTKPVVAAVNGFCFGGGLELALACDFIFAADTAQFSFPEIALGLVPGFGGTQRILLRVKPAFAKHMIMTGERIDANNAHASGLVDKVFVSPELLNHTRDFASELAAKAPIALTAAKRQLNSTCATLIAAGLQREMQQFQALLATADAKEGFEAFFAKRKAIFQGK